MSNSLGILQASVSSTLHLEMDRGTGSRATEVPRVPKLRFHLPLLSEEREGRDTYRNLAKYRALLKLRPKRQRRASEFQALAPGETDDEQKEFALRQKVPEKLRKYFGQRYRLFHIYDEDIQLDEEAWYSVTPEKIAAHTASRFSHLKLVVSLYSCVGGNSIQFAKAGIRVIAVEIDERKIDMAKHNAAIYNVTDGIEFKKGDVSEMLSLMKDEFDTDWGIFLSPPWGRPGYAKREFYDVSRFKNIVETAIGMSANVAILVPRNISNENVVETFGPCEVEENYLGGKLKTKTLYFRDVEGRGAAF